jgi:hypothetical protein
VFRVFDEADKLKRDARTSGRFRGFERALGVTRATPAKQTGVSDHARSPDEVIALLDLAGPIGRDIQTPK